MDEELYALAGAQFELRAGEEVVAGATSDADGNVLFSEVPVGSYYVYKAEAPEGYVLDTTPYWIEVTEDGVVWKHQGNARPIFITNAVQEDEEEEPEPVFYYVFFFKTGEDRTELLAGAEFNLVRVTMRLWIQ